MDSTVNPQVKIETLKKQACFAKLTPTEIEDMSKLLVETQFNAGDTIVTEGDPVDSFYLILEGNADVRHILIKEGKPEINSVATLKEGAAIGLNETGFYSLSGKRTATIVANTHMLTLRLSMAAFHGFSLANHHVNEVMRSNATAYLK